MVNTSLLRKLVVGEYSTATSTDGRTKVTNGPIYNLSIAQQFLKSHGLAVVNADAEEDMLSDFVPSLKEDELVEIVLALKPHHYRGSERCQTTNRMIVDADGYRIPWNRRARMEATNGIEIYVKLGFRESNPKCLIVSIH